MSLDRYLRDDRGKSIEPGWRLLVFRAALGVLLVPLVLFLVIEVFRLDYPDDLPVDPLVVLLAVVLSSIAVLAAARAALQRSFRDLDEAVRAWLDDDLSACRNASQRGLRNAFRGDLEALGWFTLGLVAEGEGDFEAAAGLFSRARLLIPIGASQAQKQLALARIDAHLAFVGSALGRPGEPATVGPLVDVAVEPATLGVPSIGTILGRLENGRRLDGFLRLCRALDLRREGEHETALAWIDAAPGSEWEDLRPRERFLVEALGRQLRARSQAPFRREDPPASDPALARWASHFLEI